MHWTKSKNILINAFKNFEIETWDRLEFTRKTRKLKTYEVTLTQNLLFECFKLAKKNILQIEIFEAKNEKVNGNDIELAIETKNGYIKFPTQAKIINSKFKYPSFSEGSKCFLQLKSLIKYARQNSGIPLYLFYNTLSKQESYGWEEKLMTDNIKYYGSTFVDCIGMTNKLLEGKISVPSFWDLHPKHGNPIHELLGIIGEDISDIKIRNTDCFEYKYFTRKEVIKDFNGVDILANKGIGQADSKSLENNLDLFRGFNYSPKFQILISKRYISKKHIISTVN